MGNTNQKACFEEIHFRLDYFYIKYKNYDEVPKYSINILLENLNNKWYTDNKTIWFFINGLLSNIPRWRYDMEFILNTLQYKEQDNNEDIYKNFIKETFDLENDIVNIVKKYSLENKLIL